MAVCSTSYLDPGFLIETDKLIELNQGEVELSDAGNPALSIETYTFVVLDNPIASIFKVTSCENSKDFVLIDLVSLDERVGWDHLHSYQILINHVVDYLTLGTQAELDTWPLRVTDLISIDHGFLIQTYTDYTSLVEPYLVVHNSHDFTTVSKHMDTSSLEVVNLAVFDQTCCLV